MQILSLAGINKGKNTIWLYNFKPSTCCLPQVNVLWRASLELTKRAHTYTHTHTPMVSPLWVPLSQQHLLREPKCFWFLEGERFTLKLGLFYFDGLIYSQFKRREPNSESASTLVLYYWAARCFHSWAGISFQARGLLAGSSAQDGVLWFTANRVITKVLLPLLSKKRPHSLTFLITSGAMISRSPNVFSTPVN